MQGFLLIHQIAMHLENLNQNNTSSQISLWFGIPLLRPILAPDHADGRT